MNSLDRCSAKLDEISRKLSAARRYNSHTMLILIWLWGAGLPLVFLITFAIVARMH
jgi:hypothetical protein